MKEPSISVVGIGLNVFNREPTTCLQALLEDLRPGAVPLVKEELLAFIINRFDELHTTFMYAGERRVCWFGSTMYAGEKVFVGWIQLCTHSRESLLVCFGWLWRRFELLSIIRGPFVA
jgi:hypothetical protein